MSPENIRLVSLGSTLASRQTSTDTEQDTHTQNRTNVHVPNETRTCSPSVRAVHDSRLATDR
jgi:hypothetical protein